MANVETSEEKEIEIPTSLPILPVRDIVIFPYMIIPLFVGRDISIKAIDEALLGNKMVLFVTQKDVNIETPTTDDLFTVGTVGSILRMLKLPDGRFKVLIQGLAKAKINRPRPDEAGWRLRTWFRNASTSTAEDGFCATPPVFVFAGVLGSAINRLRHAA